MAQNEHVYTICWQPEVAGGITSGENIKTVEGHAVLNFEVTSFSSFRDIKKNHFLREAALDIDDNIKWKPIRVSLKNLPPNPLLQFLVAVQFC